MPRRPTLRETIQAALAGYAHELVGATSRNGENRTLREIRRLWRCRVEVHPSLLSGKAAQWRQDRVLL